METADIYLVRIYSPIQLERMGTNYTITPTEFRQMKYPTIPTESRQMKDPRAYSGLFIVPQI